MAYDPTKPANGSAISSSELRSQFAGLKTLIDEKANAVEVAATIAADTSGSVSSASYLSLVVSGTPTQAEVQAIADKIDELITLLRRQ